VTSSSEYDPGESPIEGEVLREYELCLMRLPFRVSFNITGSSSSSRCRSSGIALFALFVAAGLVAILLLTDFSTLGTILLIVWSIVCIPLWFVGKAFFHYQAMRYLSRQPRR